MRHASILFLLLVLARAASAALESGLPTSVCYDDFCGPTQQRIWNRFQSSPVFDPDLSPGVYSGVCFHNSPMLNGDRAHHGGILIDKAGDRLFFDGRFSFFTERNPYTHLSMDGARERFDELFEPSHELDVRRTFAYISFDDRFVSRRYWFRQDNSDGRLMLVGYFGPLHTILCDLRRNG